MSANFLKKGMILITAAGMFASCNDHASIEVHIDSVGKQKVKAVYDSAKEGLKRAGSELGEKAKELGSRTKNRLDELAGKDTIK